MTDKEKECAELVERSKEVIREAFKKFKVDDLAITWTGGKDSTLGLWAWKQDLEHTKERAGRRQDKEQMMARLRKLGYM